MAVDGPGHRFHQVDLLVVGERRRLAGGASQHQAVVALFHEPISQFTAPSRSSDPSAVNGVIMAVITRPNLGSMLDYLLFDFR